MEDNIRKAELYKQYYSDPAYREPYEKVKEALVAAWQTTDARDSEARERIYLMLGLLRKVDEFVGRTIASGEIDKRNLAELTEARKRGIFGLTH